MKLGRNKLCAPKADRIRAFPENAVVCLMTLMSNGDTIEASTVGREGASWISASVGTDMPCETIVVIEGTALSLRIADLDRELKENGHFGTC